MTTNSMQPLLAYLPFLRLLFPPTSKRRTPTRLQMENTECAAASLGIILQYYGLYVPLTELRIRCGVSRDGSDAANLVLAAESYGLKARGFKKGINSLRELNEPAILFWEFNHFLVFEGFSNDSVVLNDPALGPRTVSLDEFDVSYTGVVITLEPTSGFQQGGTPPSVWPVVWRRLLTEPSACLFVLLCGLLLLVPKLVLPIFSQIYIDEYLGNNMHQWLKPMLWGFAFTIAFQALIQNLELVATRRIEKRLTRRFSVNYQHQMLSLPYSFYSQRYPSDIASRMSSNASIAEFIGSSLLPLVNGSILLIFYLILTVSYSPWLGLLVLTTCSVNYFVTYLNLSRQKDANLKLQKDASKGDSVLVSALREIETIKSASIETDIFRRYSGYQSRLLNTSQELQIRNSILGLVPSVLTTINEVGILLLGFYLVIQGQLTLGMVLASQVIVMGLKTQIDSVISFLQSLPEFEADILRLEDVLEQPVDPLLSLKDPNSIFDPSVSVLSGNVVIDSLSYSFSPVKEPFLSNLSINILPGQRVAFVGPSGCGKSTLSKLIAGLLLPSSGYVSFDGSSITDIPRPVATRSISMVQQDVCIYGCSVRDNLTLWQSNIDDSVIRQACIDAQIWDTILKLPDGLETKLSEGGSNLSGGQLQRLEIARSLIKNPSILIMDEATSALDAATEGQLVEALRSRGCTQIIVAHRLSAIRDADHIVVMDKGAIVEQGTHSQLSRKNGMYSKLLLEA